jgi:hypothetical protein
MSDFLTRMAERALNAAPRVQPLLTSPFARQQPSQESFEPTFATSVEPKPTNSSQQAAGPVNRELPMPAATDVAPVLSLPGEHEVMRTSPIPPEATRSKIQTASREITPQSARSIQTAPATTTSVPIRVASAKATTPSLVNPGQGVLSSPPKLQHLPVADPGEWSVETPTAPSQFHSFADKPNVKELSPDDVKVHHTGALEPIVRQEDRPVLGLPGHAEHQAGHSPRTRDEANPVALPRPTQPADAKEPIIVTIGRVEVRATLPSPPMPAAPPAPRRPRLSLEDYLHQRNSGLR